MTIKETVLFTKKKSDWWRAQSLNSSHRVRTAWAGRVPSRAERRPRPQNPARETPRTQGKVPTRRATKARGAATCEKTGDRPGSPQGAAREHLRLSTESFVPLGPAAGHALSLIDTPGARFPHALSRPRCTRFGSAPRAAPTPRGACTSPHARAHTHAHRDSAGCSRAPAAAQTQAHGPCAPVLS